MNNKLKYQIALLIFLMSSSNIVSQILLTKLDSSILCLEIPAVHKEYIHDNAIRIIKDELASLFQIACNANIKSLKKGPVYESSYSKTNNRIFFDSTAIIEDDISVNPYNNELRKGDVPVNKYFINLDLFLVKPTSIDTLIEISKVVAGPIFKKNNNFYIDVFFSSKINSRNYQYPNFAFGELFRCAEFRIVQDEETGVWDAFITTIFYPDPDKYKQFFNHVQTTENELYGKYQSLSIYNGFYISENLSGHGSWTKKEYFPFNDSLIVFDNNKWASKFYCDTIFVNKEDHVVKLIGDLSISCFPNGKSHWYKNDELFKVIENELKYYVRIDSCRWNVTEKKSKYSETFNIYVLDSCASVSARPVTLSDMVLVKLGNDKTRGHFNNDPSIELFVDISEVTYNEYRNYCSTKANATTNKNRSLYLSKNGYYKKVRRKLLKNEPLDEFNPTKLLRSKENVGWKKNEYGKNVSLSEKNKPVVHISYEEAKEYCRWYGKRLPTSAEWESIAEKTKNDKQKNMWHIGNSYLELKETKKKPPDSLRLHDFFGNAREWCTEEETGQKNGVLKGGSFLTPLNNIGLEINEDDNDYRSGDAGFRCVKSM